MNEVKKKEKNLTWGSYIKKILFLFEILLVNDHIIRNFPECGFKITNLCDLIVFKRFYDYYLFWDICENTEKENAEICNRGYWKYISDSENIETLYYDMCDGNYDSTEVCTELNEFEEFNNFKEFEGFEEFEEFKEYVLPHINNEYSGKSKHKEEDVFEISCNTGSTSDSYPHKGIYIYYHY
ncbi:hypothetical protein PCYB_005880 [Plasmodium cynomolgi strain B]|uniref:CYIR protein n=1 Tax=Plasmodium cynomolgi (strain B) TaxID=1120755 RepID=K6V0I1_PLACD|nr:hypothetical protein PCYB_005880 [Plasmodium cynomolgi strain B]GAB69839.1 hypothetical protein PCYB_005880 [Plasmodium cynomolgi strain B]